jgi:peptide/nickel transport system permease protein
MTFEALKQMKRMKVKLRGSASLILLLGTLAIFLLANVLSPYGPNDIGVGDHFAPPSGAHLFGTDNLGRDLLSRILFGGRITVLIALGATSIALILGSAWGILAGIRGGWIDEFLMRTADALMAVPLILFALFCISALGSSVASLILVAGILLSPSTARMARSAVKAELASPYVVSAVASGFSKVRLVWNEVMVNIAPQLLVQISINAASAVMLEATLSFVGFGLQPPNASLGTLILQGYAQIYNSIWFVLFPVITVMMTILVFNNYGEQLRLSLDSKRSSS